VGHELNCAERYAGAMRRYGGAMLALCRRYVRAMQASPPHRHISSNFNKEVRSRTDSGRGAGHKLFIRISINWSGKWEILGKKAEGRRQQELASMISNEKNVSLRTYDETQFIKWGQNANSC
jgi:hypothetical protein